MHYQLLAKSRLIMSIFLEKGLGNEGEGRIGRSNIELGGNNYTGMSEATRTSHPGQC